MHYIDIITAISIIQQLNHQGRYPIEKFGFEAQLAKLLLSYKVNFRQGDDFAKEKEALLQYLQLNEFDFPRKFIKPFDLKMQEILEILGLKKHADKAPVAKKPFSDIKHGRLFHVPVKRDQADEFDLKIDAAGDGPGLLLPHKLDLASVVLDQFRDNELQTVVAPVAGVTNSLKSIEGYQYILKCFIGANPGMMSDERVRIERQIDIFEKLKQEAIHCKTICDTYGYGKTNPGYQREVQALTASKMDLLKVDGQIYVRGGYSAVDNIGAHAAYFKIHKEGNKYYRTDYNAGDESTENHNKPGEVWSVCVREITAPNPHKAIKDMLELAYKKRTRLHTIEDYESLRIRESAVISAHCSLPDVDKSYSTNPQGKGNCSSRSLREILRDNLPEHVFNKTQEYIQQNEVPQFRHDFQAYHPSPARRSVEASVTDHKNIFWVIKMKLSEVDSRWQEFTCQSGIKFGFYHPLTHDDAEFLKKLLTDKFGLQPSGIELLPSNSQQGLYRVVINERIAIIDQAKFASLTKPFDSLKALADHRNEQVMKVIGKRPLLNPDDPAHKVAAFKGMMHQARLDLEHPSEPLLKVHYGNYDYDVLNYDRDHELVQLYTSGVKLHEVKLIAVKIDLLSKDDQAAIREAFPHSRFKL